MSEGAPALAVLCAGAAKGLLQAIVPAFSAATGVIPQATFGAVGALRERLASGAPCDVVVLTAALIRALETESRVVPGESMSLGTVHAGLAVRSGEPRPVAASAASLRATLLRATRLYFPDPQRSTAGIHFAAVLDRLAIRELVASRCSTFPDGATAMQALAQSGPHGAIGCTQVTEINYTPGVVLAAALPSEFDLKTEYVAGVCVGARNADFARRLVRAMAGPDARELRVAGGFGD